MVNKMNSEISFIIKPVSDSCNLSCTYCYYGNPNNWRTNKLKIKKESIYPTLEKAVKIAKLFDANRVKFIWHGGEPLLAGKEFYKVVGSATESLLQNKDNVSISHSVQTNGTLLDDEFITILYNSHFHISISFDCLPEIHDNYRKTHTDKRTSDLVISSIKRVLDMTNRVSVLSVITPECYHRAGESLDFLLSVGVKRMDFHPATSLKANEPFVSPRVYSTFMLELFDKWMELDDESIRIRTLWMWLRLMLGGKSSLCTYNRDICGKFLTLQDDMIKYCDDYSNDIEINFQLGSFWKDSDEHIINNYNHVKNTINEKRTECYSCKWYRFCAGQCPRYWYNGKNYFCSAFKDIFEGISNRLNINN